MIKKTWPTILYVHQFLVFVEQDNIVLTSQFRKTRLPKRKKNVSQGFWYPPIKKKIITRGSLRRKTGKQIIT